jgi:hypothetical protein
MRSLQQLKNDNEEQLARDIADAWVAPAGLKPTNENGAKITAVMDQHNAAWSHNNLTAAALSIRDQLDWEQAIPTAPAPVAAAHTRPAVARPVDNRSRAAKLFGLGLGQLATTHVSHSDKEAAAMKRTAELKAVSDGLSARLREREAANGRWADEHATAFFDSGRIDHAETSRLRNAAVARNASAAKAAKQ